MTAPTEVGTALTVAHRAEQKAIGQAVQAEVLKAWSGFDPADVDRTWPAVARIVSHVVSNAYDRSSGLAANYLTQHAGVHGVTGLAAKIAPKIDPEQLATALRVTGPVAVKIAAGNGNSPANAGKAAIVQLVGAAQRMALLGGRLTIDHTVQSNDRIGGYRRVGRGDSCRWCERLIGRGAVYKSEQTAGGSREYHDHCNCQPEPWYGDDVRQDGPLPATPAEQVAADERDLTALTDDELSELLADPDADIDAVVGELDRRDVVEQAARKAEADRQKRAAAREAKHEAKHAELDAEYDRRLAAGDDPESAYADVFGTSVEQQRRDQAIAALRADGYDGPNFDTLSRRAFAYYVEESYFAAEAATRGRLLNGTRGLTDTRDTRKLFSGNEAYARANASEELLSYWQEHGRLTLIDYQASLLGGALRVKGVASWA